MKKACLLIAVLASSVGAAAQKPIFGIKAGLNLAKLSITVSASGLGSFSESSDNLVSFTAGGFLTAPLGKNFGIQPELLYSGQGGSSSAGDFKLGYILMPVMLRYNINETFSLQGGPQLGILINATVSGVDAKDQMNSTDFGLAFGFGGDFAGGLTASFRYIIGFSNTLKVDLSTSGIPGLDLKMTNQVMQFSLGYKLSKD